MPESLWKVIQELPRVFIGTTIVYFFIIIAFRISGKNGISELSLTDFVIILVISEAANSGIIGDSKSILSSIVAITTLLGWDYVFKRIKLRYPRIENAIEGMPLVLVNRGVIIRENLEKADMDGKMLAEALRKEGVGKVEEVKLAILEPGGSISVIQFSPDEKK